MAVETSSLTLFSQGNVFSTLAAGSFEQSGLAAKARGLRAALDPLAQVGLQNTPLPRPGFSADTPALFYHPNNLSLQNFLLLAELNTGFTDGFGEPSTDATNALFTLQEFASLDRLPFLLNDAERVLRNAPFGPAVIITLSEEAEEEVEEAIPDPRVSDFTKRPNEVAAFGSTYDAVASDASLDERYVSTVALRAGRTIQLSDLVQRSTTGAPTHYAVSILNENGGGSNGKLLDGGSAEVADSVVLTAAEFATYSYQAGESVSGATSPGTDYISIIELSDPGGDGTFDGRGAFQTVGVTTSREENRTTDRGDVVSGYSEELIDYKFFAETGRAVEEIRFEFSGINSLGITDVVDAINQSKLRIKVSETLNDGSVNEAVVDLYVSSTNTLVANFQRGAANEGFDINGIDVEVRSLDSAFDISNIEVTAKFG